MARHHGNRERRRASPNPNGPFHWGNGPGSAGSHKASSFAPIAAFIYFSAFMTFALALGYVVFSA